MSADYVNVNLDANDVTQAFPLGTLGSDDGGKTVFEYVKFNNGDGAVTVVAGHLAVGLDSGYPDGEVTNDPNSATIAALDQDPRGFLQRVVTDLYYGWIQTWGRNRQICITSGAINQGETVMAHATTTAAIIAHDASAVPIVGIALEAASGNELQIGELKITIRR